MFQNIIKILGGDPNKREIQSKSQVVEQINALEPAFEALSDEELLAKTDEFRARLAEGETLDDLLPEAFAAVREASKRTIGLRHFDVQMIGGMTLHEGKIAEMRTGEGKTLVATLALYLNGLTGQGAHLVTVNDYLARRDARWMAPIYHALGLTVGVLQMAARTENGRTAFLVNLEKESPHEDQHQLEGVSRKEAYQADITYGTNAEFGFDYLRDNLTNGLNERVQRGHAYAIIDEVDNILIDEARTPLIISGPASEETEWYVRSIQVVRQLNPEDYEVDEKNRVVSMTEIGEAHVEELLGMTLRDPERPEDITPEQARILGYLEQTLRAQFLYKKNKDYLVQNGKVVIVDEFTGRLMPGRRWSEGLHQAVEAKEGVKIEPENITYATITLQNYFRMYTKLAGMTGTALTEAEEFYKIYKLDVLPIPMNLEYTAALNDSPLVEVQARDPSNYKYSYYARRNDPERKPIFWRRQDFPDVVFRSEEAKLRQITLEIIKYFVIGRPQLIGTTSVDHSERLSRRLEAEPIRRLLQVMLLRKIYTEKNNIQIIERSVPELTFMNKPILELEAGELRPLARTLGLSLNLEEPDNLSQVLQLLELTPDHAPRLVKALQGGIQHSVLNAKKHDEESLIIANAGAFGAVTIATNMAGRGVDIRLGGELPDEVLQDAIRVLVKAGVPDPYDLTNEQRRQALLKLTPEDYGVYEESVRAFIQYQEDMVAVRALGGLHVIGSERHEARRIDNQLRGRAGRQGDPGSSRFFLSMEDELMRLFGGAQGENLMRRLNIDEMVPIESGVLGRLVEQSQMRVEGSNFDVRKHLLEYDDVLNSQRKRIYAQRDLVFTKDDLSEDVLEMLELELRERVPQNLQDEEGPWKLLAFLEQIQPSIDFEGGYCPSFTLALLLEDIRQRTKQGGQPLTALQDALLSLAADAFDAEREHVERSSRSMLERTTESLEAQVSERLEALDSFFSALRDAQDDEEENLPLRRPQEVLDELTSALRLPVRLNNEQMRRLADADPDLEEALARQVEQMLKALAINRSLGALERRLEEPLNLKPSALQDLSWDEAAGQLLRSVEEIYDNRRSRLLSRSGQISTELESAVNRMGDDALTPHNQIQLLSLIARGQRVDFDSRTHRRSSTAFTRLNFIYYAARLLENTPAAEVSEDVLDHMLLAQSTLQTVWGLADWNNRAMAGMTLTDLEDRVRLPMQEQIGEERFAEIADLPLNEISPADRDQLAPVLGKRLQTEVYRHILLEVISEQWVEYLTKVEALRVSIGLEAYAQRDPLVMYKGQASELFKALLTDIRMGVVNRMFNARPRRFNAPSTEPQPAAAEADGPAVSRSAGNPAAAEPERKKKRRRH